MDNGLIAFLLVMGVLAVTVFLPPLFRFLGRLIRNLGARLRYGSYLQGVAAVAQALGFTRSEENNLPLFHRKDDDWEVGLAPRHEGASVFFDLELKFATPLPGNFTLRTRRDGGWINWRRAKSELLLSDWQFEKRFSVRATDPALAWAVLGPPLRRKLIHLLESSDSVRLSQDGLRIAMPLVRVSRRDLFIAASELAGTTCKEILVAAQDIPASLQKNITRTRAVYVKEEMVRCLGSRYGSHPRVKDYLRGLLQQKSRAVQVAAASFLGEEGVQHVLRMLEHTRYLTADVKIEIMDIVGVDKVPDAFAVLTREFRKTGSSVLKRKILELLAQAPAAAVNSFLLREQGLKRNREEKVQAAILELLGKVGDHETYRILRARQDQGQQGWLARSLELALERLVLRLGLAPGQLSVAEYVSESGALSRTGQAGDGALSDGA